ncbi:class I SAM-dependent methyltransferase [Phytohabitans suffuscus]|uniref:S-adenosyl-L-methionine-dependent methyltransferase n=1 Tax=Phytohabitans suffuscus TaxID=624315 RepID=A0A6F8YWX6_9ACTN|nr:class I SAM-dependent methyltransferase [Phytohabitans suffuscus]BCB90675.1 S-adenosyl-L-methionine-dependent methyltransferase [Phytohabitans suffuscus]
MPEASRTAVLVCQGRAVAHGRIAPGRFADPVAMSLLRGGERDAVEVARAGTPPQGVSARIGYESLTAVARTMVPRTVAVDDAVRERPGPQLVILGAGLDGRAFRMAELSDVDVYEVDHPASQADKRERAAGLRPVAGSLRWVPVDLARDALGPALAAAGHDGTLATTWVWEGVVPYLRRAEVAATVRAVAGRSAPGSRLVVNYQSPSLKATLGLGVARAMARLSRRPDPTAREPRRSAWTPERFRALLAAGGWRVATDDDLLALATRLPSPTRHPSGMRTGRVAVADLA